jgi:mRNA-degrading endonuclease toxin of MazEF toxin-antitoxin module
MGRWIYLASLEDFLKGYFQLPESNQAKAFDELIHYVTENEYRLGIEALSNLQMIDRKRHSLDLSKTVPEIDFRNLVSKIAVMMGQLQPLEVTDALKRISLYTKSAKEQYDYIPGTKMFRIALSQFQMIHVDFAGLGSEHLGEHPAIVWNTEPSRDHIVVIPCTSYKVDTTVESETAIDIGPARFFDQNKNETSRLTVRTVVLLDQIQSISRKRITRHKTTDPATNRGGIAKFGLDQIKRIEEGLKILFFNANTFFEKELLNIQGVLPELTLTDQYLHMHRSDYTIITDDGQNLIYELDQVRYTLIRRATNMTNKNRKKLLKEWNNPRAIKDTNGNLIKTTPQVRQQRYNLIQTKYQPQQPAQETL